MIATTFNHAGGVGKTSIVLNVGHELAQQGYRVLLIDLDPQANLTSWLGVHDARQDETVYYTSTEGAPLPQPRQLYNLELIPATIDLAVAESIIPARFPAILSLRKVLRADPNRWDVVLIDGPPSLGQLAGLGALASDLLLVPISTRTKGAEALRGLHMALKNYQEFQNDLRVGAYIPTMYDSRRREDNRVLAQMRETLPHITAPIPERAAEWNRAATAGKPVTVSAPRSDAAEDVRQVTRDLIEVLKLSPRRAATRQPEGRHE